MSGSKEFMEKYKIIKTLGKGTFGEVYLVYKIDEGTESFYVLKLIKNVLRETDFKLIDIEDKVLKKINCSSPHLLCLKDSYVKHKDYAIFVFDYVKDSITLKTYFQIYKSIISKEYLKNIFNDILNALIDLYQFKVIHLDIKPDNILINNNTKKTYLIDYGLACIIKDDAKHCNDVTSLRGSIEYISPEIINCKDNCDIDYYSDVYSLGILLTYLISKTHIGIFTRLTNKIYFKTTKHFLDYKSQNINDDLFKLLNNEYIEETYLPFIPLIKLMINYNQFERPSYEIIKLQFNEIIDSLK